MNRTTSTMQQIGILGSPTGPYVRELVVAAANRFPATSVHLLSFADLHASLIDGQLNITCSTAATADSQPTTVDLLLTRCTDRAHHAAGYIGASHLPHGCIAGSGT